jgi:hypothetical protein
MHAQESRCSGKSLSSGKQAHMSTVQPIKHPECQH